MFKLFKQKSIIDSISSFLRSIVRRIRSDRKFALLVGTILLIIIIIGARIYVAHQPAPSEEKNIAEVQLVSVNSLLGMTSGISLLGNVQSVSEGTVLAEMPGQVIAVYKKTGDSVVAGEIVAEIENSAQRAAVLSAQGGLAAAQANLEKIRKGTRAETLDVLQIQETSAAQAYADAKTSSLSAIQDALSKADDAIRDKADMILTNPRNDSRSMIVVIPNSQLQIDILASRGNIEKLFGQWQQDIAMSGNDNPASLLQESSNNTATVRAYLDKVATALSYLTPSDMFSQTTIDGWKASVSGARSTMAGVSLSLSGTKDALTGKKAAYDVAVKQREQGVTGAQSEDIAAVQAAVQAAQGGVAAAQAAFAKTQIRAPLSGTINYLPLRTGNYASAFQPVLTVANNNALEITAYVTEDERASISVGSPVTIDGTSKGVITRIAPALDPVTKKIEVKIGVKTTNTNLTNGQSVIVTAEGSTNSNTQPAKTSASSTIPVPITAIKITPDGSFVYTLSADNKLEAHTVTLGPLLGDTILVTAGLDQSMTIVKDARGLKEGEAVTVQK